MISSPLVSWLGRTRWVPGSCLPHPQMVTADWSTLAWVHVGSPPGRVLNPKYCQQGTQPALTWGPNLHTGKCCPVSFHHLWVWSTISWDPMGAAKSANQGCLGRVWWSRSKVKVTRPKNVTSMIFSFESQDTTHWLVAYGVTSGHLTSCHDVMTSHDVAWCFVTSQNDVRGKTASGSREVQQHFSVFFLTLIYMDCEAGEILASMRILEKSSKTGMVGIRDHREEKADFRWTIQLGRYR